MEDKKVYKIQDLFKDEFAGKKVKTNSEYGEFIFTITKSDNRFDLVVRNNDEYSINDLFFISEMLKLEFELIEEGEDNKIDDLHTKFISENNDLSFDDVRIVRYIFEWIKKELKKED